jgi:hypothetical protein
MSGLIYIRGFSGGIDWQACAAQILMLRHAMSDRGFDKNTPLFWQEVR